jgi:hypothetical protein
MGNKGPRRQVVATVSQAVWIEPVSIDWTRWKAVFGVTIPTKTQNAVERLVRVYRANRKHAGSGSTITEWKKRPDDDPRVEVVRRRERGVETVEDVREVDAFAGAVRSIRAEFKKAGVSVSLSNQAYPDDADSVRPFERFIGEELTGDGTGPSERNRIYRALKTMRKYAR